MLIQLPEDAASALPNGVHVGEDAVYVTEKKKSMQQLTEVSFSSLGRWHTPSSSLSLRRSRQQWELSFFNRVCGFSTKDPPRVGKVMKALKYTFSRLCLANVP